MKMREPVLKKTRVGAKLQRTTVKLRDISGASIVIALVFFLICAVIGSVVVTAASVQAKAVVTHQELQQDEFTVSSAAQLVGSDLASARLDVNYEGNAVKLTVKEGQSFATEFWEKHGDAILTMRNGTDASLTYSDLTISANDTGSGGTYTFDDVHGSVTVDRDLNIAVALTLTPNATTASSYDTTVLVQCIPTYNVQGKLTHFEYEQPIIKKTGAAA